MPVLAAIIGAFFAMATFGFSHTLWGAALGFLLGAAYHFQLTLKNTEESFTSKLSQLQTRIEALELKLNINQPAAMRAKRSKSVEVIQEPLPETLPPRDFEKIPRQSVRSPRKPKSSPSPLDWVLNYFASGNTIAKVGIVLLFFGVAFLLKYVSEQGLLPIEVRLSGTALGALALLGLGWKLRARKGPFGLLLQGGGVGIFYLTVFASFQLYHLLPSSLAFVLLLMAVILSSCLAVLQDSRSLAVFSVSGGFLAPVLTSTGDGSHIMLFGYYAVLNLGILGMSWFKSWRALNLVGFAFTFLISSTWGVQYYRPEFFTSTEPFLVFFFLLYFGVSCLFASRKKLDNALIVDGTLVFGVPAAAFALQAGLVKDTAYGLTWSAIVLGAFYLTAARILFRRFESLRPLVEALFALGVCFLTLAVPLAFDGKWTAAIWALEGAAILWGGVRQNSLLARCSGMALQGIAGLAFLLAENRPPEVLPIFNAFFLGTFLLSISHLLVGYLLLKAETARVRSWEKDIVPLFLVIGIAWWITGGVVELNHAVPTWYSLLTDTSWIKGGVTYSILIHSYVLFLGLSTAFFYALSERAHWEMLGQVRLGLIFSLSLISLFLLQTRTHPLANIGSIAWLIAFATHYGLLHRSETRENTKFRATQHYLAYWLLAFLSTWEAYWLANHFIESNSIWSSVVLAIIPSGFIWVAVRSGKTSPWPLAPWRPQYLGVGTAPLLTWITVWLLFLNFTDSGDPQHLPYIPIVNPLDLTQFFVLLISGQWYLKARKRNDSGLIHDFSIVLGGSAFVWMTAALTRTLHHWAGLPWNFQDLFSSNQVQSALSIFWSLASLGTMSLATRKKWRALWISGACLLGIVVLKLFLVDLSERGTLERVVSFIGTGILLLLVGYLAPMPPDSKQKTAKVKKS